MMIRSTIASVASFGVLAVLLPPDVAMAEPVRETIASSSDLDQFCRQYPLNSECDGSEAVSPTSRGAQQTFQILLRTLGPEQEQVRINIVNSTNTITLTAQHVIAFEQDSFLNQVPNPVFSLLPGNRQAIANETAYLIFEPDSCEVLTERNFGAEVTTCPILGQDQLILPADIDLLAGTFTVGYLEQNLERSVSFRLTDQQVAFDRDVDLAALCADYPLNAQCEYWSRLDAAGALAE